MTNEKEYTRMNILFFITPKSETAYLYDDCSLRQAIEKIEYHKYTAVPVLNKKEEEEARRSARKQNAEQMILQ